MTLKYVKSKVPQAKTAEKTLRVNKSMIGYDQYPSQVIFFKNQKFHINTQSENYSLKALYLEIASQIFFKVNFGNKRRKVRFQPHLD